MDSEILTGQIGQEGSYDVEFKDGKLVAKAEYSKVGVSGVVSVEIGAEAVLDAIAKAIPGKIDDQIILLIKLALKAA